MSTRRSILKGLLSVTGAASTGWLVKRLFGPLNAAREATAGHGVLACPGLPHELYRAGCEALNLDPVEHRRKQECVCILWSGSYGVPRAHQARFMRFDDIRKGDRFLVVWPNGPEITVGQRDRVVPAWLDAVADQADGAILVNNRHHPLNI